MAARALGSVIDTFDRIGARRGLNGSAADVGGSPPVFRGTGFLGQTQLATIVAAHLTAETVAAGVLARAQPIIFRHENFPGHPGQLDKTHVAIPIRSVSASGRRRDPTIVQSIAFDPLVRRKKRRTPHFIPCAEGGFAFTNFCC
jgi:hypothetical protein